jgi:hypothetical protein
MTYEALATRIDSIHPNLIAEIYKYDLPKGKEKHFTLGNFGEIKEEDNPNQEYNQYCIYMLMDHTDAEDDIKLTGALAHEYGHFLCRTQLYPNLPGLGHIIMGVLQSRQPFKKPKTFIANLIVLLEELMAWLVGWGILLKLNVLKKGHLQYGWRCWKTYWSRMRPWIETN